jgi:cyanophycinase-like exopeptidase
MAARLRIRDGIVSSPLVLLFGRLIDVSFASRARAGKLRSFIPQYETALLPSAICD